MVVRVVANHSAGVRFPYPAQNEHSEYLNEVRKPLEWLSRGIGRRSDVLPADKTARRWLARDERRRGERRSRSLYPAQKDNRYEGCRYALSTGLLENKAKTVDKGVYYVYKGHVTKVH